MKYKPKRLKVEVLPYDNVDFAELVGELQQAGFVEIYQVDGEDYLHVVNFRKHQRPHKNEVLRGTDIPQPVAGDDPNGTDPEQNRTETEQERDENVSNPPDTGYRIPDTGYLNPEKQQGSASSDASPAESEEPSGVREFPTKDGKAFALPEQFVQELKSTYPRIDVEYQLQKARLWLIANPGRQKTRRGMTRFLNNWMGNQKPAAKIHSIQSRHNGFDERDYSEGLIEGVPDGVANF